MAEPPFPLDMEQLRREVRAATKAIRDEAELEKLRVSHLGRKAPLTAMLRSIRDLPPTQRGAAGKAANELRESLEGLFRERMQELRESLLDRRLTADSIDVTLPGDPPRAAGHLHLVTQTRRELEDIFVGLGFQVAEGPEVEYDHYNFTALNHPPGHPARLEHDTFYLAEQVLLRSHTSPMQIRAMEQQPPPIYIVVPGRVYRRDSDATHTPMFHQLEGLAIDEDISMADLRGVLLQFARAMFGEEREVRLRSGYFPFTEPSLEVDVSCFTCDAKGHLRDGSRCPTCRGTGWIEILGSGMVDPNVLGFVIESGYDPEQVQGFAFGMGIDRIAMLKHGVPDLRPLFENDVRLLEQFGA